MPQILNVNGENYDPALEFGVGIPQFWTTPFVIDGAAELNI